MECIQQMTDDYLNLSMICVAIIQWCKLSDVLKIKIATALFFFPETQSDPAL